MLRDELAARLTWARNDTVAPSERDELAPTAGAGLLENGAEIIFQHLLTDHDALGYSSVRVAGANEHQDLSLAAR